MSSDIPYVFDSQILASVEKCLRYYQLRHREGWRPNRQNDHLIFGGHFAKALERYYKYVALGQTWDDALRLVVRETLVDSEGWESNDTAKTRENLIRSIVWYVDQFKDESIKVVNKGDGTPAVEYSFRFEVDYGIIFAGHIDRLVTYLGHYYVMDQKTTGGTVTAQYFKQFSPDTQMSFYTYAGKVIYGEPIKGVILDVAQIAVGFTRFERGYIFRSESMLEEWYDDTMYWIGEAQAAVENNRFPQNRQSCDKFGGCEFREICSRSPEVRHNFLRGDFKQEEPWDPLRVR